MPGANSDIQAKIRSVPAKAIGHPLRFKALTILTERTASPIEIARQLDESVGNVNYHVRKLEKMGLIEPVRTRQVRGAVEHFYKAKVRPFLSEEEWLALSQEGREADTLYVLQVILTEFVAAMTARSFDARPDRCLARVPGLVDEAGWTELHELHAEALERTLDIMARSSNRMAREPEKEAIPVSSVMMFFERPSPAEGESEPA